MHVSAGLQCIFITIGRELNTIEKIDCNYPFPLSALFLSSLPPRFFKAKKP
jgi:hypothetical protein